MAFPTISWKPSCMGVQYHVTSPQEYTSLSTSNNTLDVQCYTSPQDSLSTNNNTLDAQCYTGLSTNNNPLEYISNRLLVQDYEELHDTMPIEGYSALADLIALGAQNQLLNSTNLERSNIDWLNQAPSYEYKDAQLEPYINSSSTISSTTLSPPPHIIDHYNSFGNQALATYINDSPLIVNNLDLHNKPLGFEAKSLDLHPIEQELAMYHNVGACTNEENLMPPCIIKSLAQGDQINTISLFPPSSLVKQKAMKFNPPSSICRSHHSHSCVRLGTAEDLSNEERGNAVVKREERENENHVLSCNMFGYSSMMLNSNTPIQLGGVRRETEKKRCREEGALSLCKEERETSGSTGKRENKYTIGDERETRRGKKYIGDEREEGGERYDGSLVEVKRENVSRKRGRENYVCKRRARGGGGVGEEEEEEEEEVILVRARRGQATDSHSLAERVRRERISQRMKLLQDLVPSCTKVLGKAAVLEEIINYVKSLQQQIEFLSMRLATTDYQKRFQI